MTTSDEFRALNAKVGAGEATDKERARWGELKQQLFAAQRGENEKRSSPRAAVPLEVTFTNEEDLARAIVRDVGAGGISVALNGSFELDAQHEVQLRLPQEQTPLLVNARVAWIGGGHVGFEFLNLPKAIQDRLDALVWEEIDVSDL